MFSVDGAESSVMTDDVAAVLDRARELVDPAPAERAELEAVTDTLVTRAEAVLERRDVTADVVHVGSSARNTWVAGDRDIDLFVRFSPTLDRDALRQHGLAVGHAVLPEGREEYAEHPYVTGTFRGFDVDIVPCYDVPAASEIRSAVDRTPFHDEYLTERLDPSLAAGVRLIKGFCSGVGVYGSDLRTRGFSGYLVELLVLEYGGARALLEAAASWQPPVRLDPADHGQSSFDDPLVVIDPTDPNRNVAAVLSAESLARFQHYARQFLAVPDMSFFEEPVSPSITPSALREHLERRDTTPVALVFPLPELIEDDLYPQLRTSRQGVVDGLDRQGFDPLRATTAAINDEGLIFVELSVAERPAVERHAGPPVHVPNHAETFFEKYADDPDVYGPFLDDDRYVVERPRDIRSAVAWLESDQLLEVKHGAAISTALEEERTILTGESIVSLLPRFETALAKHFDPSI